MTGAGALPPRASERVVDQRLDDRHETEHVREMIDAFRERADAPLVAGNRVALLVDGPQTLKAIRNAIENAQHHVHLETYIFADDEIGRALRELLIRRRQQGIEVRVLYDAIGSVTTPAEFFGPMRQAGVEVLPFRPLNPARTLPWQLNNRDHRKIVVVDGRIAFTGGSNIRSTYASASSSRPGPEAGREEAWRDTHVQMEGPYALLHAKSMVIDTALSMVGSANFDMRSFLHNNEVNAVVVGSEFAQRLEAGASGRGRTGSRNLRAVYLRTGCDRNSSSSAAVSSGRS